MPILGEVFEHEWQSNYNQLNWPDGRHDLGSLTLYFFLCMFPAYIIFFLDMLLSSRAILDCMRPMLLGQSSPTFHDRLWACKHHKGHVYPWWLFDSVKKHTHTPKGCKKTVDVHVFPIICFFQSCSFFCSMSCSMFHVEYKLTRYLLKALGPMAASNLSVIWHSTRLEEMNMWRVNQNHLLPSPKDKDFGN